jgi:hypothetical protein
MDSLARRNGRRTGARVACALLVAVTCPACASHDDVAPTPWPYVIDFQSKDAAVSVDTLEVSLFDAEAGGCAALVSKRRSDQALRPIAHESALDLCDLVESRASRLVAPYGDVSVLVVAKKEGRPLLIGCGEQHPAAASGDPPVVTLTNFDDTVVVRPSACATIAAYCAKHC